MGRRKSLLIGINYFGTSHQLKGCINDVQNVRTYLIQARGFPSDPASMLILTDDQQNPLYKPTGHNMMEAFRWLVSGNQPGDSVFLHYSGHGGQVRDPDGDRASGFDDTICPLDFESHGQIDSDTLHKALITPLARGVRFTIIFDCCHSGTAVELPYVYRSDENGNVNPVEQVKRGMQLAAQAGHLLQGGFSMAKVGEAKMLLAGAQSLFKSFKHMGEVEPEGLGKESFVEGWEEGKDVWMFSGCRDDQTSADTSFNGQASGAMSWAFIQTMARSPQQSYVQVLQSTRGLLLEKYSQVPQLSVGDKYDLNQPVSF